MSKQKTAKISLFPSLFLSLTHTHQNKQTTAKPPPNTTTTLKYGWWAQWNSAEGNWFSLRQLLSIVDSFLVKGELHVYFPNFYLLEPCVVWTDAGTLHASTVPMSWYILWWVLLCLEEAYSWGHSSPLPLRSVSLLLYSIVVL